MATLATTLKNGCFHAGTYSSFRQRRHGRPLDIASIPATRLMAYTCTHDQVGNRAVGDRPSQNRRAGSWPSRPLWHSDRPTPQCFFMGEEWASSRPFQFFSSHPEPELAKATAEGRRSEFADHGWDAADVPIPRIRRHFTGPNSTGMRSADRSTPGCSSSIER